MNRKLVILLFAALILSACDDSYKGLETKVLSSGDTKELLGFDCNEVVMTSNSIDGNKVTAVAQVDALLLAKLQPELQHTGFSVMCNGINFENGIDIVDFSNSADLPVVFTIVASDGTTRDYEVTITNDPNFKQNITDLIITEIVDCSDTDMDYIEIKNMGTETVTLTKDLFVHYGESNLTTNMTHYLPAGSSVDPADIVEIGAEGIMISPGEIFLIGDLYSDYTTTDLDNFKNIYGKNFAGKVLFSTDGKLFASTERPCAAVIYLKMGIYEWSRTPVPTTFTQSGITCWELSGSYTHGASTTEDRTLWVEGSGSKTSSDKSPGVWP